VSEITELLAADRSGDDAVFDRLVPRLYPELRRLARAQLRRRGPGETLDTTSLVNETYLKLAEANRIAAGDRCHLLSIVARAMRMILVDHARSRHALKRGGESEPVTLDATQIASADRVRIDVLDLERAMERLAEIDRRLCRIVECRYFGGMTEPETAEALAISVRTVQRDWKRARAWLRKDLSSGAGPAD
jgi:RNA polymerase sigma factor (TIGR02999 family)